MTIGLIITLIIVVFLFILAYKLFKSIVKAMFSVGAIIVVVLLIVGIFIIVDAKTFQSDLEEETTYVLMSGEEVLSAFKVDNLNFSNMVPVTIDKIGDLADDGRTFLFSEDSVKDSEVSVNDEFKTSDEIISEIKETENDDEKSDLFSSLLQNKFDKEGATYLFLKIKDESVELVKETPFIKFIKFVPSKLLGWALDR